MTDPAPSPAAPAPLPKTPVFRRKSLGRAFAATGILLVFSAFFLDLSVKWALEKAGTKANGAKVELRGVRISLLHLSVALNGLQITDAAAPMTNALEAERIAFRLEPAPLTWKKIVIDEASVTGIRTGTPRRSSGALPGRAPSPAAPDGKPAAGAAAPSAFSSALADAKAKFDPRKMKAEDLASFRKIKEEQVHWASAADGWQARVDAVKTDDADKEIKAFIEKVRTEKFSGAEGLKNARELLKEGKKIKGDLDASRAGFASIKKDLASEMDRAKGSLKEVEDLKKQDADGALGGLNGNFSTEGIVRSLIGPAGLGKVETGLSWFRKIRALLPQKKKGEKNPAPPPRAGTDISFPFKHRWPTFLLKKAALSGETQGGLAYTGTLQDVASDPKKWGRPITLDVSGRKGAEALTLRAELDYTQDTPRERARLAYGGFSLAGVSLGDAGGPVTLGQGTGRTAADLAAQGDQISGRIDFVADPVTLRQDAPPKGDRLAAALHDALAGVKKADVAFLVSDRLAAPTIKIRSSLDAQVAGAVKAAVQKQLDELKAQAQARVNDLVGGEQKKLTDLVGGRAGDAAKKMGLKDKQIQSSQEQLQKALNDLAKKEAFPGGGEGGGKPNLKNLFKKR